MSTPSAFQERAQAEAEVLWANASFYQAFTAGDLAAMRALWAADAPLSCLHPGMPLLAGRGPVLESWAQILSRPPPSPMRCDQARVQLFEGTALVLCYEGSGERPSHLAATNVFVRERGHWRLVHHHAGPLSQPMERVPDRGLN